MGRPEKSNNDSSLARDPDGIIAYIIGDRLVRLPAAGSWRAALGKMI
jgi:hypothetical protein